MTNIDFEKIYHIYVKNTCLYHSLKEEEFNRTWKMLTKMIDLLGEKEENLDYEEILVPLKNTEQS
jgi:hypothetical protein